MTGPVVAGHQPNFFPWFGYFEKMLLADVFVFSDDVQYTKQNYVNRVEIPVGLESKPHYWTLEVLKGSDQRIADKLYLKDGKTFTKLLRTVQINLGGLPFFKDIAAILVDFEEAFWRFKTVADLNIHMNTVIARRLGIETPTRRGTELGLDRWHATERLIKRLEALGADTYLSGGGASAYMDEGMFASRGFTLSIVSYRLGPELFGDKLKYSVLAGIGFLGCQQIATRIAEFRASQSA